MPDASDSPSPRPDVAAVPAPIARADATSRAQRLHAAGSTAKEAVATVGAPVKAAARTVKRHLVPQYTLGEEIANSITHGIGAALGIAALVVMVVKAAVDGAHPASLASAIIFGVALILEYLASTLYHAIAVPAAKRVFRVIDHSCIYLLIAGTYTPFCLITLADLEYLASTLYHAIAVPAAKRVFRVIDHSCIYLLIAGTYTPFCLITLADAGGIPLCIAVWAIAIAGVLFEAFMRERQPHWLTAGTYTPFCLITLADAGGIPLCIAVWAIAIAGVLFEAFMRERQPHWLTAAIYVAMGWLVVFRLPQLVAALHPTALVLLAVGGVCYTVGAVFYVLKKIRYMRAACRGRRVLHRWSGVLRSQEDSLYAQYFPPVGSCRQRAAILGGGPLRDLASGA